MTTDLIIRTNGRYVSEGTLTIKREGVEDEVRTIYVSGVGKTDGPVELQQNIPHGSTVVLQIVERSATEDEIHAAPNGDSDNTGDQDDDGDTSSDD